MMGRHGQLLAATAIALVVAATIAGCGGNSPLGFADRGCAQIVLGVQGRVVPETSGLTCAGVKRVIGVGVPATPGGYLIGTREPRVFWKCHKYPSKGTSTDLISCSRGGRSFAIRRVK
jgi:hypothetical protein